MFGHRNKDEEDVSDQLQGGMDLNRDNQAGGDGGGDNSSYQAQDAGYGGQDTGYGGQGSGGQDTGYGGQSADTGYWGQSTDTGYGGGEGEKKHHHKETDDSAGYGAGGVDSSGYGAGGDDPGYGAKSGSGDGYGAGGDQGYGGGDTALGGGVVGGDQYSREEHHHKKKNQEATFGGDQTSLDAGGDTGYGDTQTKQGNYGGDDTSGYGSAAAGAGAGALGGGAAAYGAQDQGAGGYGGAPSAGQTKTSLSAGDSLRPGQSLKSASGQCKLVFQEDGNIVLYKGGQAVWATGTDREQVKPTSLNLQDDGNVALYGEGGKFVGWATNTGGRASGTISLVVSDSGKLVLLSDEQALWSSSPVDSNEARDIATSAAQAPSQDAF